MERFFDKSRIETEDGYIEKRSLFLVIIASLGAYLVHGITFLLFAPNPVLLFLHAFAVVTCIVEYFLNRANHTRVAAIMLVLVISASIVIWSFTINVGTVLRWYIMLAIPMLALFSVYTNRDRKILFPIVLFAVFVSSVINLYIAAQTSMPNAEVYNVVTRIVIVVSVTLETFILKFIDDRKNSGIRRIETMLANIQCGVVIVDPVTHELVEVNPVATEMFGGPKELLIGQKCHNLICFAEENACPITDEGQEVDRSERMLRRIDGSVLPIIKSVAKIMYGDRMVLLESFTDISSFKKAEEQLRLMEITEKSNKAKSDFLSRMSHEMRTPMNAIIGMAQVAAHTNSVEKLKYCLSMIDVSSTHLLGLINDILDMSKIEAGKLEIESVPLHIEDVLIKVCNIMRSSVEKKDINMQLSFPREIMTRYYGDEMRLSQVITNLISNAVKFTPEHGHILFSIVKTSENEGIPTFRFTVKDNGIGMSGEQVEKLFSAFEQGDGSITRKYGGTGLGLAISKNIIEKMGGKIWVESQLGKGSSFIFEIPLTPDGTTEKRELYKMSDLRVAIVEKEANDREHLRSIAQWFDIAVDSYETIEMAMPAITQANDKGAPYTALYINCDGVEPDQFGSFSAAFEKADKATVILTTQLRTWNRIERVAQEAGYAQCLVKPLFPTTFLASIQNVTEPQDSALQKDNVTDRIPDFSNIKLLLAEDVPLNREVFIALLEDTKISIDVAENGQQAVDLFQKNPERYQVIIMDIQMPVMNGFDATKAIRSLDVSNASTIPIVALTANAFKEDVDKCINAGMNGHLMKPIEVNHLFKTIAYYCNK